MSYDEMFAEALRCFDQGQFEDAEALLRQISETAPDHPEVLNLLGLVAQAKGLHSEACSYFSAAIRQKPNMASFYFNLAFSLKASGQYADALVNFNKVLQLAPQIKETHNEIACIYENLAQLETARSHWQTALKMAPDYLTAQINLANSYRLDDPDKAKHDLQQISQTSPDEPLVWYNLAWLAYSRQDYQSALPLAQKAESLTAGADAVKYLLGIIYLALQQNESAEHFFLQAELLNDFNFDAKLNLANIFSRSNRFDEAESRYLRLLELNPKHFDVHNNYAEMLYRQKRLSEALEEYRQAVIINPQSAEVSNNLGVVLKDLKEYDEALGLFFNALAFKPEMSEISINIAETIILLAADDEAKAAKIAANWQHTYPNNPFALHINAALQGENIAPNQIYTEKLFDNFADNYELVIQNLDYSAPMAIRRIAGSLEGRIADLGCGTGLVGLAIKTDRNQIIGVDLSTKMLDMAAQKKVYTELVKADILQFLSCRQDYDWVIAADVLGYMGALDEFIKLCRGKNLIFSIELLEEDGNYKIQKSGRYKHSASYVEYLLQQNGFCAISKEDLVLRNENGVAVKGCIFKALKGTANG